MGKTANAKSRVINIFIIGAQKAGTSTLKSYLAAHESIVMHDVNEFGFFVSGDERNFEDAFSECYPPAVDGTVVAAKNVGVLMNPRAIERLADHNPNMKIVVSVRDPVDRAFSAFLYARREGLELRADFAESVFDTLKTGNDFIDRKLAYLENGIYHRQLDWVYQNFAPEQVLVLKFEDLVGRAEQTLDRLWDFCEVPPREFTPRPPDNVAATAKSGMLAWLISERNPYKKLMRALLPRSTARDISRKLRAWNAKPLTDRPTMNPDVRARLEEFYRPHNAELARKYGIEFGATPAESVNTLSR